jgi:predicted enzyme related to lactoylglutathione lyase
MTANPVGWFEIYVGDMSRAKAFYEAVFQKTLNELPVPTPDLEMWSFPWVDEGDGAAGALVKMEGCPPGGNSTLVYFSCEDCAVEESRVAPAGGQVCKPKFAIGQWGFISLVLDTEGNMIGLHSTK